jgi:PleD family two-component response regulator
MPNTFSDEAIASLDRLREDLALAFLDGRCPRSRPASVSHSPTSGDTLDEIVAIADEALFAAKESGRNRVVVAGQSIPVGSIYRAKELSRRRSS